MHEVEHNIRATVSREWDKRKWSDHSTGMIQSIPYNPSLVIPPLACVVYEWSLINLIFSTNAVVNILAVANFFLDTACSMYNMSTVGFYMSMRGSWNCFGKGFTPDLQEAVSCSIVCIPPVLLHLFAFVPFLANVFYSLQDSPGPAS